ncbi:hypothetical protein D3C71_1788290 [compost metagenome]
MRYPKTIIVVSARPMAAMSNWLGQPNKMPMCMSTPQRISLATSGNVAKSARLVMA